MPKTLLVVDDSTTIRQAARLALAGEDWQVVEAPGPRDALEAVEARAPDAILCDATLGDPDGYELSRRLRRLPGMGPVPIVLMGAKAVPEAARAAGATATLPKPFGSRELLEALEAAVESQAFSGDLAADLPTGVAPLTLAELDGPLSFEGRRRERGAPEGIEIIDLSGGEEFEDLDLIEDLEPVAAPGEEAGPSPWELPAGPQEAPVRTDTPVFDVEDLFSTAPVREPEPAGPFSGTPREPLLGGRGGGDADFEGGVLELDVLEPASQEEEPPAAEPAEPRDSSWMPLEGAADTGGAGLWSAPFPDGQPEGGRPPAGPWAGAAPEGLAEATERAVRETMGASLTTEALLPTIQAVVERVVWEVVPPLAERLIQESIDRLRRESPPA